MEPRAASAQGGSEQCGIADRGTDSYPDSVSTTMVGYFNDIPVKNEDTLRKNKLVVFGRDAAHHHTKNMQKHSGHNEDIRAIVVIQLKLESAICFDKHISLITLPAITPPPNKINV